MGAAPRPRSAARTGRPTGSCATTAPLLRLRLPRPGSGRAVSPAEADPLRRRGAADEDDLAQVDGHRALLGLDIEPTVGLVERLAELPQLRIVDPDFHHATTREADRDSLRRRHQCAGSTISVSTPPVERGWTKATRESRIPTRGSESISSIPAPFSVPSVPSMSSTA